MADAQFQFQLDHSAAPFHPPWGSWLAARVCNLEVNIAALWAELTALRDGPARFEGGRRADVEAKLEAAAKEAEANAEAAEANAEEARREAADLKAEAAKAKAEAAEAKAEAMKLRADALKLEADSKQLKADAAKAKKLGAEARKSVSELASELERVRSSACELETRFGQSVRERAEAAGLAARLEALLSESAEREEARAVRHEADMAAAMALVDNVLADSEKRVAKTKALAAKQKKCAAELDLAFASVATRLSRSERSGDPKPVGDSPIERNKSRGFMLCVMALSQGVDDVHMIATGAGRVPSPTMTREESYSLKKTYLFSKRTLSHLRNAVNRFGAATAGDRRGVSFPIKPGAVIRICEGMVLSALRTVFDANALSRMNDALCCVVEALDVGLDAYGATARLDDPSYNGFGLAEALEAAPKFEGDDEEFQRSVMAWSSTLRVLHPWRERADEMRAALRAAGVPLTKRPVPRLLASS